MVIATFSIVFNYVKLHTETISVLKKSIVIFNGCIFIKDFINVPGEFKRLS